MQPLVFFIHSAVFTLKLVTKNHSNKKTYSVCFESHGLKSLELMTLDLTKSKKDLQLNFDFYTNDSRLHLTTDRQQIYVESVTLFVRIDQQTDNR